MSRTTALAIAGTILLIVALTMGEGGVVSQLAENPRRAQDGAAVADANASTASTAPRAGSAAGSPWYAADPQPAQAQIPVYTYPEVHIPVPQAVVDPKVAASSEIQ